MRMVVDVNGDDESLLLLLQQLLLWFMMMGKMRMLVFSQLCGGGVVRLWLTDIHRETLLTLATNRSYDLQPITA